MGRVGEVMFVLSPAELCLIAINGFGAMQKPVEFMGLLECVGVLRPRVVLEIGVGKGGTSWAFSKLDSVERLVAVDLPAGPWGGEELLKQQEVFQYIANNSKAEVTLVSGNSQNAECLEKVKERLCGDSVDFLFIDGDHSYEGVKTDFLTYSPLVRSGGLIAFHDICKHEDVAQCHVDKFWAELKAGGLPDERFTEFVQEPVNWGGIGVVKW